MTTTTNERLGQIVARALSMDAAAAETFAATIEREIVRGARLSVELDCSHQIVQITCTAAACSAGKCGFVHFGRDTEAIAP